MKNEEIIKLTITYHSVEQFSESEITQRHFSSLQSNVS